MRKITQEAVAAFAAGRAYSKDNTTVADGPALILHGHMIARRDGGGALWITNAGYATNVTKERLNGLPGVSISQRKGVWYLNGQYWGGQWIEVQS